MSDISFIYKNENFEGPLDLLLSMIEKRKLLINHVSLSSITEDFVNFINSLHFNIALKQKADFVSIASILMLIKAKSLLPTLSLTEDEVIDIEKLEKRLKILEIFRNQVKDLQNLLLKKKIYEQGDFRHDIRVFAPSNDINKNNIYESILRVIGKIPKPEQKLSEIRIRKVISLEEVMLNLSNRVKDALKMSFKTFSGMDKKNKNIPLDKEEKVTLVVSFLAMLELVKQNLIMVEQTQTFEDIQIESLDIKLQALGI